MNKRFPSLIRLLALLLAVLVLGGCAARHAPQPTEAPTQYTVSFEISDPDNFYSDPAPVTVTEGESVAEPVIDRVEDGSHFDAWYTSPERTADSKFDFSTPITGDLTLYAARIPATEPETVPATEPETVPATEPDAPTEAPESDILLKDGCGSVMAFSALAVLALGAVLCIKRRED